MKKLERSHLKNLKETHYVLNKEEERATKGGCSLDEMGVGYIDSSGNYYWRRTSECTCGGKYGQYNEEYEWHGGDSSNLPFSNDEILNFIFHYRMTHGGAFGGMSVSNLPIFEEGQSLAGTIVAASQLLGTGIDQYNITGILAGTGNNNSYGALSTYFTVNATSNLLSVTKYLADKKPVYMQLLEKDQFGNEHTHSVLITGISYDNSYIYYNPTTGYTSTISRDDIKNPNKVVQTFYCLDKQANYY